MGMLVSKHGTSLVNTHQVISDNMTWIRFLHISSDTHHLNLCLVALQICCDITAS